MGVIGVGLMAMSLAGAPRGLVFLQGGVGAAALIVAAIGARWLPKPTVVTGRLICGASLLFMASPFLSEGLEGVQRWLAIGAIQIQPAAIALPLIVWYAVREDDQRLAVGALLAAGAVAAFQPDQQVTQGVMAVALGMVLLVRPTAIWWAAFGVSVVLGAISAFGHSLDPVPYVEQILPLAFDAHWMLGAIVALGLAGVPLIMLAASPERRPVNLMMAVLWIGLAAACLRGQFPTPVLGYGLSWILGFALSLGLTAFNPPEQTGLIGK